MGSEGQDGRLLYDRLLSDGWELLGIGRDTARSTRGEHSNVDVLCRSDVRSAVHDWNPNAIFYLAAVHGSSQQSQTTSDDVLLEQSFAVNVQGVVNFLEVLPEESSLFYAASSHVFGKPDSPIQDETTPFRPDSIYGITKAAGVHACRYYRESRRARASAGIFYNHESPYRRSDFVSRRIAEAAVAVSRGHRGELVLGDLTAEVDWGYAPDYVDAMVRIALLPDADDFVVATGQTHTVKEFAEIAFACLNLNWADYIRTDSSLLRRQSRRMSGNSARLRRRTGWTPTVSFEEMVRRLVDAERKRAGD